MTTSLYKQAGGIPPRFLATFDSTSAMLMALSNFINGDDVPGAGFLPSSKLLASEIKKFSRQARDTMFALSGICEGICPEHMNRINSEEISRLVTGMYHKRPFQAIMIGSSNGSMVYLQAALQAPWLPQTFLIPVRHPPEMHPDRPELFMDWARKPAEILLKNNPELQLHHIFDPVQDHPAPEYTTRFRIKKLLLGKEYERFIKESLPRGGTIFVIDCQRKWATTRVDERHLFQLGSLGGIKERESFPGKGDVPAANEPAPEAEWGFDAVLYKDIERLAREGDYRIKRIIFEEPEQPSPFVAELYRWWYRRRRIISNRLLAGSFLLLDPFWTFRTGSVPFWMKFNTEASANWLEKYLNTSDPYDEIFLMLYAQGVDSAGLPPAGRWKRILARAAKRGELLGTDRKRATPDFGTFIRHYLDLKNRIPARYPIPGVLSIKMLESFIEEKGEKFTIRFKDFDMQEIESEIATSKKIKSTS